MRLIPPERFQVRVRIANRHPVRAGQIYGPRTIPDLQFICPLRGRFICGLHYFPSRCLGTVALALATAITTFTSRTITAIATVVTTATAAFL